MTQYSEANPSQTIGVGIRKLRVVQGVSLAELSQLTGVSEATMSRIETGRSEVSAAHLYQLANCLNVEISSFFNPSESNFHAGIRSVNRRGEGEPFASKRLQSLVLSSELTGKRMHPSINSISAKSVLEVGGLSTHDGEEFLFVIEGILELHSQAYAPLRLNAGESIYFDAAQPHAYLNGGEGKLNILVITSAETPEL